MNRIARPCIDCQRVTMNGTRCPECEREHDRQRGTRQARGYGAGWDRLSKQVIRAAGQCEQCGHPGSNANPLTADHIIPLSAGGSSTRENAWCLCRSCNSVKGSRAA